MSRLERAGAALLIAAAALPFWAGRFLPLLDLPQHLGLAAVIARAGDASSSLSRYYQVDVGITPYWAYYGTMWLLTRALPVELANRVVLSLYAIGIPLASAYLLASFGRDRRWAVLTLPLVFGTHLFFGFATFLVSIPLFLVALGLAERHLADDRTRARHEIPLAVASALVFLGHAQTYLLLGACVLVLLAVHGRGLRFVVVRCAPFLPSLALFAVWAWRNFVAPERAMQPLHTVHYTTYGRPGALGAVFEPFPVVLRTIPERLFGAFGDGSDLALGAVAGLLAAVAIASSYGPAAVPRRDGDAGPVRAWVLAHRCDLLVLALAASYLFLPMEIAGMWYLNARHLVFAALALPLLLAAPATGVRRALIAAAAAVTLAVCANVVREVRAFQRQVGEFAVIARALPPGGRVLGLPFDLGVGGPVRLWPFLHFACYEQVLAGGDAGFSFAGLPSIPVRYRPGMQAPHPYEWRPDQLDWATMGGAYDAFLVSGSPRGRGGAELTRHAEPMVGAGPFTLWKPRRPPP